MTLLNGVVWLGQSGRNAPIAGKSRQDGYPPFNIELVPETAERAEALRITLAVAGFRPDDLDVTVGDGELVVKGRHVEDQGSDDREYLHRGIAARQFKRSFGLADGVEVCKAELKNGLLIIELQRPRKAEPVRKVGIVTEQG